MFRARAFFDDCVLLACVVVSKAARYVGCLGGLDVLILLHGRVYCSGKGVLWHVVCSQRSFEIVYPFLGVLGALHVEDLWSIFAQPDPLGLRGRLQIFYSRPAMKRARDIETANIDLGNEKGTDGLEKRLVMC